MENQFSLIDGGRVTITFQGGEGPPTPEQFRQIIAYLDVWSGGNVVDKLLREVAQMSIQLDQFTAAMQRMTDNVAMQTSVTSSVLALIDGLKTEVAGLRAELVASLADSAAIGPATAMLNDFDAALDAQRDLLAAAVTANTPAAPVDPPVDPPADPPVDAPVDPPVDAPTE